MIHAYIDESGDEGINGSSSPWLVLGCVLLYERDVPGAKEYLTNGVARVWSGRKPPAHVHFQKVQSHSQRKALLHMASGLNFVASTVAVKKEEMPDQVLSRLKSPWLYNYVAKHLLERISWYGADRGQAVHVSFASRSESSWTEFESYIELLKTRPDHQIKFHYIASIRNTPANQNVLLQAADWMVSGYAAGLNPDSFGNVETCFTEILWGKFWMRYGKLWPYGTKILPAAVQRQNEQLFRKIDAWLEDPTTLIR